MEMQKSKNGKIHIWMQLLGFEMNDDDCGAKRFLNQTGFLPDSACALLFHPDFINTYDGFESEYELSPYNCAYRGIIRNAERNRQKWTNLNLQKLIASLKQEGCDMYLGMMGASLGNGTREWIEDHPEIYSHYRGGVRANYNLLKRFSDGTYYEDFFISKLCSVLKDYGFKGIHLADCLAPYGGNIAYGDFSVDLTKQFIEKTHFSFDEEFMLKLTDNSGDADDWRADFIWKNHRAEWIEFMCDRWVSFYEKLCRHVHSIGCEVMVLGMYCTAPFETKYCLGTDIARIVEAGVDCITENILPTGCYIASERLDREYYFHRYMAIVPLMASHVKNGHLVTMLGLQDASEEWDIMHHMPCMHELDLYTMMAYRRETGDESVRASEGYFLCLGDGVSNSDWQWEYKRLISAMTDNVSKTLSPVMLWSDYTYNNFLKEYINTRRWTVHKLFYELSKAGAMPGGSIRSEDLNGYTGMIIVPDFDLLSEEERQAVASYTGGELLITAKADFDVKKYGMNISFELTDAFSDFPLCAYFVNADICEAAKSEALALASEDDGAENIKGNPADMDEFKEPLDDTLPFAKVTSGFVDAMALCLKDSMNQYCTCSKPCLAYRLKSGDIRLYIFNTVRDRYSTAFVQMKEKVADTHILSAFPQLPVRYKNEPTGGIDHNHEKNPESKQCFEVKLLPGGVTVIDVIICD